MSGYGAGVEDLKAGIGKLAVSYLAGARPDIVTNEGTLAKNNIDVRYYDIKAPQGSNLAIWLGVLKRRHGLRRCLYRGLEGMKRWVGLGVLADNLINMGKVLAAARG